RHRRTRTPRQTRRPRLPPLHRADARRSTRRHRLHRRRPQRRPARRPHPQHHRPRPRHPPRLLRPQPRSHGRRQTRHPHHRVTTVSLAAQPLRKPDTRNRDTMRRRAWWLITLNLLLPGTPQTVAGNRTLGRIGTLSTLLLWALIAAAAIIWITQRELALT